MCGIIGYSGPKEPLPILINGLSSLEYRGYDSAGIAISDGNKITVEKKEGKLVVLKNHLKDNYIKGNIGIGQAPAPGEQGFSAPKTQAEPQAAQGLEQLLGGAQ